MESIKFIGLIRSPLKNISDCPLQESEGSPQVTVTINKEYRGALLGLIPGSKVILLTWLHLANRNTLTTKPRNDVNAATQGVFATRSPARPNPIGLHVAEIIAITDDGDLLISGLEVLDETPLVDIKIHL